MVIDIIAHLFILLLSLRTTNTIDIFVCVLSLNFLAYLIFGIKVRIFLCVFYSSYFKIPEAENIIATNAFCDIAIMSPAS
ncbi:MAG: hypothetical protein LBJ00_02120 [Planctomycetaceae bacterium]|nr:hypothetical protein [Planctomycetaceae bacterium]